MGIAPVFYVGFPSSATRRGSNVLIKNGETRYRVGEVIRNAATQEEGQIVGVIDSWLILGKTSNNARGELAYVVFLPSSSDLVAKETLWFDPEVTKANGPLAS